MGLDKSEDAHVQHYPSLSPSPEERIADALEKIASHLRGIEGALGAFLMIEEVNLQQTMEKEELSPVERGIADVLARQKARRGL